MPRLFAAIEIPRTQTEIILSNHSELAGARWEKQPHITLAHFGEVAVDRVEQLSDLLHQVSFEPFELHPTQVDFFGEPTSPFVMWVGLAPSAPLRALHHGLQDIRSQLDFTVPQDEFVPHITLGHTADVEASDLERYLSDLDLSTINSFIVGEFCLYESANGSYTRLATMAASS